MTSNRDIANSWRCNHEEFYEFDEERYQEEQHKELYYCGFDFALMGGLAVYSITPIRGWNENEIGSGEVDNTLPLNPTGMLQPEIITVCYGYRQPGRLLYQPGQSCGGYC